MSSELSAEQFFQEGLRLARAKDYPTARSAFDEVIRFDPEIVAKTVE